MSGKGKIHEHPKANSNGFDKRPEDAIKGGRKPSIRKQLAELMEQDGKITIPAKQIVTVNDNGSVTMVLPTQMQLAMKLTSWAMSSKGGDSIKSIQMIMEQMDGKPKQEVEQTVIKEKPFAFKIIDGRSN